MSSLLILALRAWGQNTRALPPARHDYFFWGSVISCSTTSYAPPILRTDPCLGTGKLDGSGGCLPPASSLNSSSPSPSSLMVIWPTSTPSSVTGNDSPGLPRSNCTSKLLNGLPSRCLIL